MATAAPELEATRTRLVTARAALETTAHTEQLLREAFAGLQRAVGELRAAWVSPPADSAAQHALEYLLTVSATDVEAENLEAGCRTLSAEADRLLEAGEALAARERLLRFREPMEKVALALLAITLAVVGYTLANRIAQPIDLAEGKPWKASSSWADCTPRAGRCGPLVSRILFHTRDDENPWFRLDLLQPTTFSGMTIVNRAEEFADRAVPLVVEVGDDDQTWREIARRDEVFSTWRVSFQPVTARFIRLRVARKSWLHLEAIKVHP